MNSKEQTSSKLYPADVTGKFRAKRTWVSGVLLVVFLLLPWVRIDGRQAVLLDFRHGSFSILGLSFWYHDAPMLLFVFEGAAILLAFVTSIWGRLWCGWACPQTVFVDLVFRRVERWIEGDAFTRRRLDATPWTEDYVFKKSLKWFVYTIIALVLSHSFLAYFLGTETLAKMVQHTPFENLGIFVAMAAMTTAVLFDFGFFREQFCILLCPYGRFQSVLMDEKSLAVVYDRARGEPRRQNPRDRTSTGDCIGCNRCVQVCPTGIDIRNGLQLECIACTACIDACDAVMNKLNRPLGLIRYSSGIKKDWSSFIRPAVYGITLLFFAAGLIWIVTYREPLEVTLIRAIDGPYQEVLRPQLEKEVVNHFKLDLVNRTFETMNFDLDQKILLESQGIQVVSPSLPLKMQPGESKKIDLFVRFPLSVIKEGRGRIAIEMAAQTTKLAKPFLKTQEVPLVGPLQ